MDETKCLPFFPAKALLFVRYLIVFMVRVGCIVTYFAPFIGLLDIMGHYKAETLALDYELFKTLNETDDRSYHYWNPVENEFQSVLISDLFRSDYTNIFNPGLPKTNLYTFIDLGVAFGMFGLLYVVVYGLVLTLFKYYFNTDFHKASYGQRFQHIIKCLIQII